MGPRASICTNRLETRCRLPNVDRILSLAPSSLSATMSTENGWGCFPERKEPVALYAFMGGRFGGSV